MKVRRHIYCAILALLTLVPAVAFSQTKADTHMEWWREARFGMFIHFGLFSVAGGEWKGKDYGKEQGGASAEWLMNSAKISGKEYRSTLAPKFNPTDFDAQKIVSTAKAAGMKYIVITAKHHEGFCLFDTDATDYNVMDTTPFKRDIIKELADECAKEGIRFGVYYSQFKDWYHRGAGKRRTGTMSEKEYLEMVKKNLDELMTNYGDIAVLWFDVGGSNLNEADEQGARVRSQNPNTVICSRLYSRKVPKEQQKYADFESLPDRTIASKRMEGNNETCMTMRHNWGYDRDDDNWKDTKDIIERLVLSAARGVNFLLNVGPGPEGALVPEEVERLKEIGAWMNVNGESIYGTDYSPVDFDFPWGAMTQKGKTVYLHVMKWNPDGIEFNGLVGKPAKAYFLADPKREALEVSYDAKGHTTRIKVPAEAPDVRDTVIALEYDAPLEADPEAKGTYLWSKSTGVKHNNN